MFYNNTKHLRANFVSVFFLILLCSCQSETLIINDASQITKIKSGIKKPPISYQDFAEKVITEAPHHFSPKIAFKAVKVFSPKTENYIFAWVVDLKYTDLDELQKWKLAMILKPKNKADFKDKILEKKGIKTIGVLTKPYLINNEVCILLQDFNFKPKDLQYLKFYLYNNTDRPNLNFWQLDEVSLSMR